MKHTDADIIHLTAAVVHRDQRVCLHLSEQWMIESGPGSNRMLRMECEREHPASPALLQAVDAAWREQFGVSAAAPADDDLVQRARGQ